MRKARLELEQCMTTKIWRERVSCRSGDLVIAYVRVLWNSMMDQAGQTHM